MKFNDVVNEATCLGVVVADDPSAKKIWFMGGGPKSVCMYRDHLSKGVWIGQTKTDSIKGRKAKVANWCLTKAEATRPVKKSPDEIIIDRTPSETDLFRWAMQACDAADDLWFCMNVENQNRPLAANARSNLLEIMKKLTRYATTREEP